MHPKWMSNCFHQKVGFFLGSFKPIFSGESPRSNSMNSPLAYRTSKLHHIFDTGPVAFLWSETPSTSPTSISIGNNNNMVRNFGSGRQGKRVLSRHG